jgi:hypothetical protein
MDTPSTTDKSIRLNRTTDGGGTDGTNLPGSSAPRYRAWSRSRHQVMRNDTQAGWFGCPTGTTRVVARPSSSRSPAASPRVRRRHEPCDRHVRLRPVISDHAQRGHGERALQPGHRRPAGADRCRGSGRSRGMRTRPSAGRCTSTTRGSRAAPHPPTDALRAMRLCRVVPTGRSRTLCFRPVAGVKQDQRAIPSNEVALSGQLQTLYQPWLPHRPRCRPRSDSRVLRLCRTREQPRPTRACRIA